MSSVSLSPGFFDPEKYEFDVVVPRNVMQTPEESPRENAWTWLWLAVFGEKCQCGGGGITKIYTY